MLPFGIKFVLFLSSYIIINAGLAEQVDDAHVVATYLCFKSYYCIVTGGGEYHKLCEVKVTADFVYK